jgi:(p)ppGpp synthase/HD superfamily hydrolase
MMDLQDVYNKSLLFAAEKHRGQDLPGTNLPYLTHVVSVATEIMIAGFNTKEFDVPFAVCVALLHDTMEDTETSYNEVKDNFGEPIAESVLALTKFDNLKKSERMQDSLDRIKMLGKEVWSVKLADRISNLGAPAIDWDKEKRKRYKEGAENILKELGEGNEYLAKRLEEKIKEYQEFVVTGEK